MEKAGLLRLSDSTGRIIREMETKPGSSFYEVELRHLTPGLYLMRYDDGENIKTEKVGVMVK